MALIECPECGGKVSDKAPTCIHCGYPLQEQTEQQIRYCPYCGKTNNIESTFCGYCGKSFVKSEASHGLVPSGNNEVTNIMDYKNDLDMPNDMIRLQQAQIIQQQRQLEEQRRQFEAQAKCPRCGSTSLSGGKQGFGVGKAVAGVVLFGGVGALAGGIGANKTVVTCMNCGYKFKF
ncbi:MAG: zinc ribbon domain-containing protein [Clostridiales bacterium]|nr:zinc ribbon domain-containing protein [Clostridiales bacterium]